MEWICVLRTHRTPSGEQRMSATAPVVARPQPVLRCAIYTRKSTEEGLEQEFNSLMAQREAAEAYILSQREHGWIALEQRYDDGGYSGGNVDRPALKRLLEDANLNGSMWLWFTKSTG